MSVERLAAKDWPLLREVKLRALSESPHVFASTYDCERLFTDADWQVMAQRAAWWVATDDHGAIVGMAGGQVGDKCHQLVALWASPSVRGQKVADSLVEAVAQWARDDGATELRLFVAHHNDRARRFYQRLRFEPTGLQAAFRGDETRLKAELGLAL